jgi:threonine dehydratase
MAAAIWAREQSPEFRNWKIIGVEPATADRYHQSINSHRRVEVVHDSVCDGAAAPQLSKRSYDIIRAKGNGVVTVSDDDVLEAMDRLWREGHIVEPTAALGVAAWSQFPRSGDYPVATFMTGGNVTRVHEAELQAYRKESGALLSPIRSLVAERLIS